MSAIFETQTSGFFNKVFQFFFGFTKKPLKRSIIEIITRLKDQKTRLEEIIRRLRDRHSELFHQAVKAWSKGDVAKATIYANEVAEIRKIVKNLLSAVLALEQVIIRLDTIRELEDVGITLRITLPVLEALKGEIKNVVPDVAIELESVIMQARSIVSSTETPPAREPMFEVASSETKKILNEVKALAELRVRELLPEVPKDLLSNIKEKEKKAKVEKKEAEKKEQQQKQQGSQVIKVKVTPKKKINLNELEKKLIDYIVSHGGFLDVEEVTKSLGASKEDVMLAIENLKKKGQIIIKKTQVFS